MPRSLATDRMVAPGSRASRTASTRNSGGYADLLAMWTPFRDRGPNARVSTKRGQGPAIIRSPSHPGDYCVRRKRTSAIEGRLAVRARDAHAVCCVVSDNPVPNYIGSQRRSDDAKRNEREHENGTQSLHLVLHL